MSIQDGLRQELRGGEVSIFGQQAAWTALGIDYHWLVVLEIDCRWPVVMDGISLEWETIRLGVDTLV